MIYISFDIGIKNLAFCILKDIDNKVSIIDWGIICLAEKKKSLKGANSITKILYVELDNIISNLNTIDIKYIDKVIIENQPSNLNGVMKTIQYLVFSYFDLLRHWDNITGDVILINPVHKLQNHDYELSEKQTNKSMSKNEKYRKNKNDSIEICKHYVKNDEYLNTFFNSHKKKDDLADTCLQAISYIIKTYDKSITCVHLDEANLFELHEI